ncbi:Crp/Fnr family transcriptional regulator [Sphingomonas sp. PsM26]|jgi:CRP-like cAMP-binding protein|nr:Crp/Fnr family transcriptional regulator [Sphingomonas sp. PsM26]
MINHVPALSLWLDRLELRSVLNDDERQAVLSLPGQFEVIKPNHDFVRLDDNVNHVYSIASGLTGSFGQLKNGERQMTALHLPGNMANLHSIVLPSSISAIRSINETLVYRITHKFIHTIAADSLALSKAFWRDCTIDAAVLSQWSVMNARLPALGKVAHILCEMCCRFSNGICQDGSSFEWQLTQVHLADITGLTAVHVNRMLRAIREDGAAEIVGRRMHVLNWTKLVTMAKFDPRYLALEKLAELL